MRRDIPDLPEHYYVNSFISGLSDYIQAHLQCHKPEDMQKAMWMARRIEQVAPTKKKISPNTFSTRRPFLQEQPKHVNTATPSVI
jgi:hypothetical protein